MYIYMVKRVATRDIVPLWVRVSLFFYIKILVSGQENIACDKITKMFRYNKDKYGNNIFSLTNKTKYQNEYEYYKTVKGNFVVVQKPAPEVEAVSYAPSCTAAVVSEGLMRSILGMYDLNKYEEIFGVEELDIL